MNRKQLDVFEKLAGQLSALYDEISALSKKAPNDAINKFKLGFVNTLLSESNEFLGDRYKPFQAFTQFEVDDVPQNSDLVFILAQYLQCFEKFRADNVQSLAGNWYWTLVPDKGETPERDGKIHVRTTTPKRLRE
jgi:hypothetical protein